MPAQRILQVLAVAQIVREKKPVTGEICPICGGPAEIDLFWSTSADNPGTRVLKKQTCCGGHPRRSSRYHKSEKVVPRCPVRVEIVTTEMETPPTWGSEEAILEEPETVVLKLVPARVPPPARDPAAELEAVLDFLTQWPDEALEEIGRLAEVTREFNARRARFVRGAAAPPPQD